jgi:hypothetical protein
MCFTACTYQSRSDMRSDLHTYMVQSHLDDLRREAVVSGHRAEARRAAAEARHARRLEQRQTAHSSSLRRLVTRFAL